MKFLYTSDLHFDENTPKNRIDDFQQTRIEKFNEIVSIAKQNKVSAILHGGDFFNRAKMSNEYINSIIELFSSNLASNDIQKITSDYQAGLITETEFLDNIKNSQMDIPFLSIIGNHDIIGDNIESYERTSLSVLENTGLIHIINDNNIRFFQDKDITVAISGSHYNREFDKTDDKSGYCVLNKAQLNGKEVDFQIHLTHGMLMPKSYGKKFAHTTVYDIEPITKADLTINGHDHVGFDEMEINSKKFINPGSPFRLTTDKNEINRKPKVLLITIDKNGITLKHIYLKCAKKGDEVLSEDAKTLLQTKQNAMAKIQSMINQSSLNKSLRIADIIDDIGQAKNIDTDILKDVQDKIIDSMNLLQPTYNPSGEYYITRVELKNFLSHKDSTFDFEPGLNILSGESRSGKSAVLRALREVLTCSLPQPRDAIFFGEDYFSITVYTSNGYIVTRKVEKNEKKGFNGYEIYDPNKGSYEQFNTKALPIVQEILGYNKIPLTDKKDVDINSVIQGDSWFYVGNNITSPDRARLLGVVYGTHYADAANKEIGTNLKRISTQINTVEKDKKRLEDQTLEYDYLTSLNKVILDSENLYTEVEKLEKSLDTIKKLYNTLLSISNEIEQLKVLQQTMNFNVYPFLTDLKQKQSILDTSKKLSQQLTIVTSEGTTYRNIYNQLIILDSLKSDISDLKKKSEDLTIKKSNYQKYLDLKSIEKKIVDEQTNLNSVQNNLVDIETHKNMLKSLQKDNKDLEDFKTKVSKVLSLKEQQDIIEKEKLNLNNILNNLDIDKFKDELKALQENQSKLTTIKQYFESINKITTEGKQEREKLQEVITNNGKLLEEYQEILENLGECPICHSKIDSIIVKTLVEDHRKKLEV